MDVHRLWERFIQLRTRVPIDVISRTWSLVQER